MVLELIAEAILPFVGRVLGYIVMDLLAYGVFYFTGLAVLKILTLGRYPDEYFWQRGRSGQDAFSIMVGLLVWVALLLAALVKYTG